MKIYNYMSAYEQFHNGDIVWACAFSRTENTKSLKYFTEPVKGMFTRYKCLKSEEAHRNNKQIITNDGIQYFIPFKKNSQSCDLQDLAWSKAVHYSARKYATTEDECKELFNELIDEEIQFHQNIINDIQSHKI